MSTILLPRTSRSILRSMVSRSWMTGISFCCTSMTTRKASARCSLVIAEDYTISLRQPLLHFTDVRNRRPPLSTDRNDHPADRPADRPVERQREHGSAPALHRRRDFSDRLADGEEDVVALGA